MLFKPPNKILLMFVENKTKKLEIENVRKYFKINQNI